MYGRYKVGMSLYLPHRHDIEMLKVSGYNFFLLKNLVRFMRSSNELEGRKYCGR